MSDKSQITTGIIEVLLYCSIGFRVFGNQIGILKITGLSGALIIASGFVCLVTVLMRKEKIATSIYFALFVSFLATIVDLYYYDYIPRNMLYWTSLMLMMCYIVHDRRAHLRCAFFLALCILASLAIGGSFYTGIEGVQRLNLEPGKVGTMFGNPNDLAQISVITAIALLYLGFKSALFIRVFCIACSLALIAVTLLTLSRQGLILLLLGLVFYLLLITMTPGRRIEVVTLVMIFLGAAIFFRGEITQVIDDYAFRFGLESGRLGYWETAPRDMLATWLSGYGSVHAYTSEGLKPHSAFLWVHLAYGGFCAMVYAMWILWLGARTTKVTLNRRLSPYLKIETVTMFTIFLALQFTAVFTAFNFGCILAVATMEKNFTCQEAI